MRTTPFGGYKESGFGGRDKGLEAFDEYTETKTVWNLGPGLRRRFRHITGRSRKHRLSDEPRVPSRRFGV